MKKSNTRLATKIVFTFLVPALAVPNAAQASLISEIFVLLDNAGGADLVYKITPDGDILNQYASPDPNIGPVAGLSIAEGGNTLLLTNSAPLDLLYRLDPDTGAVLSTETLNTSLKGGLSYERGVGPGVILAINDGITVIRQDGFSGPTTSVGPAGASAPGALGGDDTGRHFLSTSSPPSTVILEIDTDSNILGSIPAPTNDLSGLAFDGDLLYAISFSDPRLFTVDPSNGNVLSSVVLDSTLGFANGTFVGLAARKVNSAGVIPEPASTMVWGLLLASLAAVRGVRGWRCRHFLCKSS